MCGINQATATDITSLADRPAIAQPNNPNRPFPPHHLYSSSQSSMTNTLAAFLTTFSRFCWIEHAFQSMLQYGFRLTFNKDHPMHTLPLLLSILVICPAENPQEASQQKASGTSTTQATQPQSLDLQAPTRVPHSSFSAPPVGNATTIDCDAGNLKLVKTFPNSARFFPAHDHQHSPPLTPLPIMIYEGMTLTICQKTGLFELEFLAEIPRTCVTMNLDFTIHITCDKTVHLTLPPITLHGEKNTASTEHPSQPHTTETWKVRRTGSSEQLKGLTEQQVRQATRCGKVTVGTGILATGR